MKKGNKGVTFSTSMLKRTKALIAKAKKEGKIKHYTEAFKDCPVENEVHKGAKNYYCN